MRLLFNLQKTVFFIYCFFVFNTTCIGQSQVIELWNKIPNQQKTNEKEIITFDKIKRISNVQNPSIEAFLAPKNIATDIAVIICPGGGYGILAYEYEGVDFAKWLNSKGISAFVLKYRLPQSPSILTPYKAPLQDIQRAIKIVRSNAKEWQINKNKIGVLGFSAGGHLASTAGTHFEYESYIKTDSIDTLSAKPNFMALIYPVISMQDSITHKGSKKNLLGNNPLKELIDFYSNELQVTVNTPPTFILHANNDKAVPVKNSLLFYEALQKNNILTEMHLFPIGGHGFAFAKDKKQLALWPELFYNWLIHLD